MRDKFSELIAMGVAAFQEKPVAAPIPEQDPLCRLYNSVWGLLSDTHMSKIDDGYIITGTFTQTPYWENFKYTSSWGTTNIKLASGYCSLDGMVRANGMCMKNDLYNSDKVIKLYPCETPVTGDPGVPCADCCPGTYVTAESQFPHPLSEVFTKDQITEFTRAWVDAKGDAMKIVENLKESKVLNGELFRISSDNQYLIAEGNQTIKFKL